MSRTISALIRMVCSLGFAYVGVFTTLGDLEAQTAEVALADLRSGLDRLILAPSWRNTDWGLLVVSLDHSDTLYSVNPDTPLAPASNAKLMTSAAALHALGPDYRFLTFVMTDGEVRDGVLDGNLILYGTGDPGLSSRFYRNRDEVFQRLVDQLEASGVREVRGDLVADASFLPGPARPSGWDPRDLNDHFAAPLSALSFNENVVSVRVVPARDVGGLPSVLTIPDHAALPFINEATTEPGSSMHRLAILRDDPTGPVRVAGAIGVRSRDAWRQLTVPQPEIFTASVFRNVLEARGIRVSGRIRTVSRPGRSALPRISAPFAGRRGVRVLARHASEPLQAYLEVINKQSHNLFAELVFRILGRTVEGVGSPSASARAVTVTLAEAGLDTTGLRLLDGSGLSADNRLTARSLVGVLALMERGRYRELFQRTLPQAGTPRELGRMYRTPAAGNLRAKTGTIEGVSALSGMVRAADGEKLAFSILVNGTRSVSRAKATENRIGVRLASLDRRLPSQVTATERQQTTRTTLATAGLSGEARHKVVPGENLTTIARRYGLTLRALLDANPRVDPNRIYAGQMLDIPGRTEVGGG